MALAIIGAPVSFNTSGLGTFASPFIVASNNTDPLSSSEIIFSSPVGGRVYLDFSVSSEFLNDVATITVGGQTLWLASGADNIISDFLVATDQEVKITYVKNASINVGSDNVSGSIYFIKTPLPASHLMITTQPAGATTGLVFLTQPIVAVHKDDHLLIEGAINAISVDVLVMSGSCVLSGTTFGSAVGGVLTYTDIVATGTGSFYLVFSSDGLTSATSELLTFSLPAVSLVIVTQPVSSTISGAILSIQPVIEVRDGNNIVVVRPDYEITVVRNIVTGSSATTGVLVMTTAYGVASYSELIATGTGTFTLSFTSPDLIGTTSNLVTIEQPSTPTIPVKPKRSYEAGLVPSASQLSDNELAINVPDKKGYMKNPSGVVELVFTAGATTLAALTDVVLTSIADDDFIKWNAASSKFVNKNIIDSGNF